MHSAIAEFVDDERKIINTKFTQSFHTETLPPPALLLAAALLLAVASRTPSAIKLRRGPAAATVDLGGAIRAEVRPPRRVR